MASSSSAASANSSTGTTGAVRIRHSRGKHRTRPTSASLCQPWQRQRNAMAQRRCEFVDSRLRRCPPDRASAVPYGQAGENALRFPHLAHRSAAAHKLHSATATTRIEFDSGSSETFSRLPALAYSSRNLSKRPAPPQYGRDLIVPKSRHRRESRRCLTPHCPRHPPIPLQQGDDSERLLSLMDSAHL